MAACLLCLGCLGCAPEPPANLLLISFDTTRADHLSAWGHGQPTSPHVDELARRGARFAHAYTHAPSTLPAHTSLLTGLLPPRHGVRANGRFQLGDGPRTLAQLLSDRGYATGAVVSGFPLDRTFGLGRGFDSYDGDFRSGETRGELFGHRFATKERPADEVTDRALAWLAEQQQPWFLFVHYFDPHAPYQAPARHAERFAEPYDAEIAFADEQLGRLLDAVADRGPPTLLAFTADHGEGLGEHGEAEHNLYLYDSTLAVPLVLAFPGRVPAGAVFETPVAHVDLLPTLLELLDVPVPAGLDGRSLAPALRSGAEPDSAPIYAEALERGIAAERGVSLTARIEDGVKVVLTDLRLPERRQTLIEYYDLESDPRELRNLAQQGPDDLRRRVESLQAWMARLASDAHAAVPYEPDAQDLEALRALGYLDP